MLIFGIYDNANLYTQRLKVAFDAPFIKLFTMAAVFSSSSRLETLEVFIPAEHCPALPPSPSMTHAYGSTPGGSPVLLQKPLPGSLGASDSVAEDRSSPPRTTDPHVPPLRDVRKFVRRCAVIQEVNWYGKNGRGQWIVSRPASLTTPTKANSNVTVEYISPSPATGHGLTAAMWEYVRQEEEAARVGWTPARIDRDGAEWVGMNAELYQSARAAEKEKEEQAVKEEKAARAAARRAIVTALDVSTNIPKSPKVEREPSESSAGYRQGPSSPVSPYQSTKEITAPNSPKLVRRRVSGPAAIGIGAGGEGQGRTRTQSQGAAETLLCLPARSDGSKPPTNGNNGRERGLRRTSGAFKAHTNGSNLGNGRLPTLNVPKRPSTGGSTPKNADNGGNEGLNNRRLSGGAPNGPASVVTGRGRARKSAS